MSTQTKMFSVGTGVSPNQTKPNATVICPITRKRRGRQKDTMGGKKRKCMVVKNVKIKHQWGTWRRETNSKKETGDREGSLIKAISILVFPSKLPFPM